MTAPWTSLHLERDPIPKLFSDIITEVEMDAKQIGAFNEYLSLATSALKAVLSDKHPDIAALLTNGFIDHLFGHRFFLNLQSVYDTLLTQARLFVLNCREKRVYSPLHSIISDLQGSSASLHYMPLFFKLESLGGIPYLQVSALCQKYSLLNHSCENNIATALSEHDEIEASTVSSRSKGTPPSVLEFKY